MVQSGLIATFYLTLKNNLMRTRILGAVTLTALIGMAACRKTNVTPALTPTNGTSPTATTDFPDVSTLSRTWATSNSTFYPYPLNDCGGNPTDCGPVTTIRGVDMAALQSLSGGDPVDVGNFFSTTDGAAVARTLGLNKDQTDLLASGDYGLLEVVNDGNSYFLTGEAATLSNTDGGYDWVMRPQSD
jgi:hypothetical protein